MLKFALNIFLPHTFVHNRANGVDFGSIFDGQMESNAANI